MKKANKLYLIPAIIALAYAPFWLYLEPDSKWAFGYTGYTLACFFQALNRVFTRRLKKPTLVTADIKDCVISYDGGKNWHLKTEISGQYVKLNGDAVKAIIDSHATGEH